MAILKYIPPTKKIIDNRSPEGGYYVAKCEICDTEFYPERSNAKYCTPNCGLIAHRIAVANGTAEKRKVSKPKKEKSPKNMDKMIHRWKKELDDLSKNILAGKDVNIKRGQQLEILLKVPKKDRVFTNN